MDNTNGSGTTDENVFESLDEILGIDDTTYATMKAWGGKMVRLGSLTAHQLITFLENNEKEDKASRRKSTLLIIALSLVDSKGKRLVNTEEDAAVEKAIEQLRSRDASTNAKVAERILQLNGLSRKDAAEIAKNVSGEASPEASPTVSH